MSWQQKFLTDFVSPASFDATQIHLLVWAVNFIAYNRVTKRCEMHTNLMSASGARNRPNNAESVAGRRGFPEAPLNKKFRLCRCAHSVNRLFKPDRRVLVFALTI